MQVLNYLFCRQPRDTCSVKDGYIKAGAAGLGTAIGIGTIYYAASSVKSTMVRERVQYCANQTLAMLVEVQRQLQLFNASCIPDSPGSTMSRCNVTLLPKLVNTSCQDIPVAANYLPTIFVVAAVATFGLFMGRTILTSFDQRNKKESTFFLASEGYLLNCSTEDSTTLSDTFQKHYRSTSRPLNHGIKQNGDRSSAATPEEYSSHFLNGDRSSSATPEEYSWHFFKDDEPNIDIDALYPTHENDDL